MIFYISKNGFFFKKLANLKKLANFAIMLEMSTKFHKNRTSCHKQTKYVDDVRLQYLLALPRSPAIGEREGGLMKGARDGPSVSAEHRVKGCIPGNKIAEPFQTLLPGITVSWNKRNETQFKYE